MKATYLLVLGLFCVSGVAIAEGGTCPPGYYPYNTPGVMGCAPIPGYDNGAASTQLAMPEPVWATRWGAIAMDFTNGKVGAVTEMHSKRKAEQAALAQCRSNGGSVCESALSYRNQCGVIAWGTSHVSTYSAETIEQASALALQACRKHTTDCQIYYADCSIPERID